MRFLCKKKKEELSSVILFNLLFFIHISREFIIDTLRRPDRSEAERPKGRRTEKCDYQKQTRSSSVFVYTD